MRWRFPSQADLASFSFQVTVEIRKTKRDDTLNKKRNVPLTEVGYMSVDCENKSCLCFKFDGGRPVPQLISLSFALQIGILLKPIFSMSCHHWWKLATGIIYFAKLRDKQGVL